MSSIEAVNHLQIPLQELSDASNGFSDQNIIAKGGFGNVYKGESVKHGKIAIKMLDPGKGQGDHEFRTEISLLSLYKHENIASLIGFCNEDQKKILVYRYEGNGSLDKHLSNAGLTWVQRLQICLDAARGLQYLHDDVGADQRILHRDVKSANILLDENWKAKISDFGLCRVGPANKQTTFLISNACGTFGYIDPDFLNTGYLTQRSDVYSFGVVLFEVLSGRPTIVRKYKDNRVFLTNLIKTHWRRKTLDDIIYSDLQKQIKTASLLTFTTIAYQCLMSGNERPTMKKVVEQLQKALNNQLTPSVSHDSGFATHLQGQSGITKTHQKQIYDIKPGDTSTPLDVRVIRKWRPHSKNNEICYLFVDIHGDAIEAIIDSNEENYFDIIITVHSCYTISKYLCIPSRTYMAVVPRTTSLKIGKRATFEELLHSDIPTYYFNFTSYNGLKSHMNNHKLLTDYIGRVEKIRTVITKSRKQLTKILIEDERKNLIELTLWENTIFQHDASKTYGQIMAVTSTIVTEYKGTLQLESTSATTITINPPIHDINVFANKFKHLQTPTIHSQEKRITIEELLNITLEKHTQFTCMASITNILNYGTWYYALCSYCTKKVYPEEHNLVCEDHGTIIEPKYMYRVNATVTDETSTTSMVFFNEAMTSILNISCADMVIIHGHSDPKIIPTPLLSMRGIPMILQITLKKDGTISVHKAVQTIGIAKTSTTLEMDAPTTTMTITKSKRQVQHQKGALNQKPCKKKIKR